VYFELKQMAWRREGVGVQNLQSVLNIIDKTPASVQDFSPQSEGGCKPQSVVYCPQPR